MHTAFAFGFGSSLSSSETSSRRGPRGGAGEKWARRPAASSASDVWLSVSLVAAEVATAAVEACRAWGECYGAPAVNPGNPERTRLRALLEAADPDAAMRVQAVRGTDEGCAMGRTVSLRR